MSVINVALKVRHNYLLRSVGLFDVSLLVPVPSFPLTLTEPYVLSMYFMLVSLMVLVVYTWAFALVPVAMNNLFPYLLSLKDYF